MDILTTATQNYVHVFDGYFQQFLSWGQWLFFGLLSIQIVWLALWHAFDRHSFAESLPEFIKRFFTITFFYTLMLHPAWFTAVLSTVKSMGKALAHIPTDPSSLISEGIALGNIIMLPIEKSSLLTSFFGVLVIAVVYLLILFVFISIALDLAVTLISVTALISLASFFLGFAALGATSSIARQTLDVILGHCIKLLGLYLVVAAGSQTIQGIAAAIPTRLVALDPYAWIVSATLLFWLLAKHLPSQLARIVTGALQETRGAEAAALLLSTVRTSAVFGSVGRVAVDSTVGLAKIAGSTAYHASAQLQHSGIPSTPLAVGVAAAQSIGGVAKAVGGYASDHARHTANILVGGQGLAHAIPSVPERLYSAARDLALPSTPPSPPAVPASEIPL